jgi:ectoine hydroxylase-related dioxygenase (phytanoyl-CoA dioxygenase family)
VIEPDRQTTESIQQMTATASPTTERLAEDGFAIVNHVIDAATVAALCQLTDQARQGHSAQAVANKSGVYGLRNLTDIVPEVVELVRHPGVADLVESVLGPDAFMVRATLFDKTPSANWGVFWHQDLTIAVQEKHPCDGFSAWTRKSGIHCVQPPAAVMQKVLAVRLHLDDCRASNGALKVLPGSHKLDRLSTARIAAQQKKCGETVCEVAAGGAILMRPLLLHASSPMDDVASRRVIHFEFAAFELPAPLRWKYRIPCRPQAL